MKILMENTNIHVRAIIEMLGAPKEHIEKTMKDYVEKLKNDKLNIVSEIYNDAVPSQGLFSTFVELEIYFDNLADLLSFCFDSMPSSVEIISPETLAFPSSILSGFLNDLQARIHDNDMIVKTLRVRNKLVEDNSLTIFNNFIRYQLIQGAKSISELSGNLGVEPDKLRPFIDSLINTKKIKEEDNKFLLIKK